MLRARVSFFSNFYRFCEISIDAPHKNHENNKICGAAAVGRLRALV